MRISLKSSGKWDEEKQWQYQKEKESPEKKDDNFLKKSSGNWDDENHKC